MKSNLKSLEYELRAEMSKKRCHSHKAGIESCMIKLRSICREIARNEAGGKALFPTSPPQDQTRFPSPVTAGREATSLTGLPPTVSMVRYIHQ